jgi:hypothetical protein
MTEPERDWYEFVVENLGELPGVQKTRLVRDSQNRWHRLSQTDIIFSHFDALTKSEGSEQRVFLPDPATSRSIMDEAVANSERSRLPIDICFQMIVIHRYDAEIISKT